jgi:hypothetical protein
LARLELESGPLPPLAKLGILTAKFGVAAIELIIIAIDLDECGL